MMTEEEVTAEMWKPWLRDVLIAIGIVIGITLILYWKGG
jgi:hypothetical protein